MPIVLVLLAACIGSEAASRQDWEDALQSTDKGTIRAVEHIKSMKWWEACTQFGKESRAEKKSKKGTLIGSYLRYVEKLNKRDVRNIGDDVPEIGMTTCGVFALLGTPDAINYSEYPGRKEAQLIYRQKGIYVYTVAPPNDGNGIVVSIQH